MNKEREDQTKSSFVRIDDVFQTNLIEESTHRSLRSITYCECVSRFVTEFQLLNLLINFVYFF